MAEEIVINQETIKALSEEISKNVVPVITDEVMKKLEATEKSIDKKLEKANDDDQDKAPTKQLRFMKACINLVKGGKSGQEYVTEFNQKALESRAKAGYNNAGTDADGGYIIMDPRPIGWVI